MKKSQRYSPFVKKFNGVALSWKSSTVYTVELFRERAIPLSFFTKGLYRWSYSQKGYTVKLFHERAIPLSLFTKGLYWWAFSGNGYPIELFHESEATTVLSWQQPGVVSQQRLRLRRLTLVMRVYLNLSLNQCHSYFELVFLHTWKVSASKPWLLFFGKTLRVM